MFSGKLPFQDQSNDRDKFINVLLGWRRPRRPLSVSRFRELDDDMWHLIEVCWDQDPSKRSSAAQVVETLRHFPIFALDTRSFESSMAAIPQIWQNQEQHPFSALAPSPEDTSILKDLKEILKGHKPGSMPPRPSERARSIDMGRCYILSSRDQVSC